MVNCKTNFSKQMYKELLQTPRTVSLILLIIGAVGVVAAIVLSMFFDWANYLMFFAVPFAFGLILTLSYSKAIRSCNETICNEYLFEKEFVMITSSKDGEVFATQKTKYDEFKKIKETKNFLFVYQVNNSALPIEKAVVSQENYDVIKQLVTARINKSK